jgi:hypothetical protein
VGEIALSSSPMHTDAAVSWSEFVSTPYPVKIYTPFSSFTP